MIPVGGLRRLTAVGAVACCALLANAGPAAASFKEFPIPTANSTPLMIAAGSDHNLWFTESGANKIGRITPSGTVSEFSIPTASSDPAAITAGPDGNVWFAEYNRNQIGRITPAGTITEYPTGVPGVFPSGIAAGADGNLWITVSNASQSGVLRMNTAGAITGAYTAPHRGAAGITTGPDGNLWFVEVGDNYVANITTGASPTITDYLIPGGYVGPEWIVAGPDGNLWFTSQLGRVGKVTTAGAITVYPVPTPNHGGVPAAGPDGNVWFTEADANQVAKITSTGAVTEYPVPTAASDPEGIVTGPDHNLWFTERGTSAIGRFGLSTPIVVVPKVVITKHKIDRKHHKAKFTFKATGPVTGLECTLIKKQSTHTPVPHFTSCTSPKTYKHLKPGKYTFEVHAVLNGATGPVATRSFTI